MIQVELSVLIQLFFLLGTKQEYPKGDTAVLVNSLDIWQKNELFNAWREGKEQSLQNSACNS